MMKKVAEAEAFAFAAAAPLTSAAAAPPPSAGPSPRQQRLSAAVQEAQRTVAQLVAPLAKSVIPAVREARQAALRALQQRVAEQAQELRQAIARREALEAKIAGLQSGGGGAVPQRRASVKAMRV